MAALKYTRHLLKKIEELFEELGYSVRYAKGNFQSGYCIVEHQKVAVINKFFEVDGRIGVLLEIFDSIEVDKELLSEKGLKTFKQLSEREKSGND